MSEEVRVDCFEFSASHNPFREWEVTKREENEKCFSLYNSWVSRGLEKLRLPRARPQTRPDARTRNLSNPLLTQELFFLS